MQAIVHAKEPIMRGIKLADCRDGMLAHVDYDGIAGR